MKLTCWYCDQEAIWVNPKDGVWSLHDGPYACDACLLSIFPSSRKQFVKLSSPKGKKAIAREVANVLRLIASGC